MDHTRAFQMLSQISISSSIHTVDYQYQLALFYTIFTHQKCRDYSSELDFYLTYIISILHRCCIINVVLHLLINRLSLVFPLITLTLTYRLRLCGLLHLQQQDVCQICLDVPSLFVSYPHGTGVNFTEALYNTEIILQAQSKTK